MCRMPDTESVTAHNSRLQVTVWCMHMSVCMHMCVYVYLYVFYLFLFYFNIF